MSIIGSNILAGASGAEAKYTIDQSMYFGDAPSTGPKLSRQFDQTGSASPKWTYATWYKKGPPDTGAKVLYYFRPLAVSSGADLEVNMANDHPTGDTEEGAGIRYFTWPAGEGSVNNWDWNTGSKLQFYDFSAWYHICHVIDHGTSPYVWIYINGVLQDINTIYSTQTGDGYGNKWSPQSGDTFFIGSNYSNQCGNAYFADTYWIEQQALNPVGTFGEVDEDTGVFVPIEYTGTYSGNSFYLDYADSSDFGTDRSGLGNDFTVAGIGADQQVPDTPTNNFATLNPIANGYNNFAGGGTVTFLEGNRKHYNQYGAAYWPATMELPTTGKWYFECYADANSVKLGLQMEGLTRDGWTKGYVYSASGAEYPLGTVLGGTGYTSGTLLGIAVNLDDGEIKFYLDNVLQYTGTNMNTLGYEFLRPGFYHTDGSNVWVNFGADSSFAGTKTAQGNQDANGRGDFYYAPPSGHLALCTLNLPVPAIKNPASHFNPLLYTGDGATRSVTGVGFQPDLIWFKNRETTDPHLLYDVLRGFDSGWGEALHVNNGDAQVDYSNALSSFDSDGFSVGSYSAVNNSSDKMASWSWKAGGAGVSNGTGTITSTVSANTTAGFSIVTYTGNDTSGATVGHGLSSAPEMVILKPYTGSYDWNVYSKPVGNTKYLYLNETTAETTDSGRWNDSTPSASVVTIGDDGAVNSSSESYVMYCFHAVDGFSKIGSYIGNELKDGTFIYLGFKPAFVIFKNIEVTTASGQPTDWLLYDNKRAPSLTGPPNTNANTENFWANLNSSEASAQGHKIDLVSNGFKIRGNEGSTNETNDEYVYIAFAQTPFKYATAR